MRLGRTPAARAAAWLAAIGCVVAWPAAGEDRVPAAPDRAAVSGTAPAPPELMPACPLAIGHLRVRTWVERDPNTLSIRFVPESPDLGRCLELETLSLVGPEGERIEPEKRWPGFVLPISIGRNGIVPAKVAPNEGRRPDLGIGMRVRLPFGKDDDSEAIAFRYDLRDAPAHDGIGPGWSWRGIARDTCAETPVPLWLPVDGLASCGEP